MDTVSTPVRHDAIFVGFKPIDDLHREFQAIVDALTDPAEADYGTHLLALHEHLLRHCAVEEQWMRDEGYPHDARHRQAHEALLESVAEMRRRFDANDLDAVRRFGAELMQRFAAHAADEDAALAAYLRGDAY